MRHNDEEWEVEVVRTVAILAGGGGGGRGEFFLFM